MTREQTAVVALVLGGLVLVWVWTVGARTGRRVERATRTATRVGGTAGRAVATAVVITGGQWAVVASTTHPVVVATVLGVPALFAGAALVRLFAVEQPVRDDHRIGGRR